MAKKEFRPAMLSFRQLRFRACARLLRGSDDDLAEAELIIQHIRDRQEMAVPERKPRQPNLQLVKGDRETP